MFTAKHLLRFAAVLFFFGLVFFVAAPARADDGVTITITNPTVDEYSFTLLGPNFLQVGSAHSTKSFSFTGLAGTYSYDLTRSGGGVTHGEFQVAAGGSVTITVGAPLLTIQLPTVSAPVSLVTLNPSAQYTPKAGKGLVVFRNMSPYQISMVVNGVGYNLDGIPSGPRTRTPQVSPYPELRFDTTPGTLEYDYTITGGTRTHGSRQVADGQLVVVEFK